MSILLTKRNRIIIQGITGRVGQRVASSMLAYDTQLVGGVAPGKGGTSFMEVPIFDLVTEAIEASGANASLVMVPASAAKEAILEAIEAGIKLIVYPGEGFPVRDMLIVKSRLKGSDAVLLGGNTPGTISPGIGKMGFMPSYCYSPGLVGVTSKSGSLSYEVSYSLTRSGLGQSSVVGIGGDLIKGIDFAQVLAMFEEDEHTHVVVLLGEIGGRSEHEAASFIKENLSKPVVAYIAGRLAPPGKKMGHAGAIIANQDEGYEAKVAVLEESGVRVVRRPHEIPAAVAGLLRERESSPLGGRSRPRR